MTLPKIVTELPGPNSQQIAIRAGKSIPYKANLPIVMEKASGSTITDVDGNVLLDFHSGDRLPFGYYHPSIQKSARVEALELLKYPSDDWINLEEPSRARKLLNSFLFKSRNISFSVVFTRDYEKLQTAIDGSTCLKIPLHYGYLDTLKSAIINNRNDDKHLIVDHSQYAIGTTGDSIWGSLEQLPDAMIVMCNNIYILIEISPDLKFEIPDEVKNLSLDLAILNQTLELLTPHTLDAVAAFEKTQRSSLNQTLQNMSVISSYRVMGMLTVIEFHDMFSQDDVSIIRERMLQQGVLIKTVGNNSIAFYPPITIQANQVDYCLAKFIDIVSQLRTSSDE